MKIINQTLWRTDHLKAILQAAAERELEPAKRKTLVVTVSYTRGGYSSGCAFVGGRRATVRIRHPKSRSEKWTANDGTSTLTPSTDHTAVAFTRELALRFAQVAAHEFAHIRGMQHDTMPANYKWHGRWRDYVAWAADMPIAVQPPKTKRVASVDDKLAHVLAMKRRAETRVKRAQTLLKKWKQKERYYVRQQAAQRATTTTEVK